MLSSFLFFSFFFFYLSLSFFLSFLFSTLFLLLMVGNLGCSISPHPSGFWECETVNDLVCNFIQVEGDDAIWLSPRKIDVGRFGGNLRILLAHFLAQLYGELNILAAFLKPPFSRIQAIEAQNRPYFPILAVFDTLNAIRTYRALCRKKTLHVYPRFHGRGWYTLQVVIQVVPPGFSVNKLTQISWIETERVFL